jgi:hypothetical protein
MKERKYWLDLFTGKTWEEFLKNGGNLSGFRERRRNYTKKIQPGDYLLCYLTGISRFIGILEVKTAMFEDHSKIWEDSDFPCRFNVEIKYKLNTETAIPITELREKLSIFRDMKTQNSWTGVFRGSPTEFKKEDGEIIVEEIREAINNPVKREFDEKLYWRKPKTYESEVGVVTVPENDDEFKEEKITIDKSFATHEEIQYILLKLGSDLGLDVWVARNDRNKQYNGKQFQNIPGIRKDLPRQFDEATSKTIELIDVLWLQGDAIVAAFEVEHTSAIYSGLLRMSDLISMQPNIKINLYLVAPDERTDKVYSEINRPTFAKLKPPLPQICKFISYSKLKNEISEIKGRVQYMKPEFLDGIAESCEMEEV